MMGILPHLTLIVIARRSGVTTKQSYVTYRKIASSPFGLLAMTGHSTLNAQSDSTCLAQAHQNRSGKRELDLTDYLVKNLTGFQETLIENGFIPRSGHGSTWHE
jgi:hypothetical protein